MCEIRFFMRSALSEYVFLDQKSNYVWYYVFRQFLDGALTELKLTASTYTSQELDALALVAASMNLTVLPNKEVSSCFC